MIDTNQNPSAAQAHVADAIAHVRQAISMAEERELSHFFKDEEPCAAAHAAEDAAVRTALLDSEDAMIQVLQTMPAPASVVALAN